MLDFAPVRAREKTVADLGGQLTIADLRALTNEMVDAELAIIADATDADVVFVPEDPIANDTFAADQSVVGLSWTLGHVVVHVTASSEEGAFLAAELARGVPFHGRSRSEVAWESVTTIAQCRQRYEESRTMRLATLELWPDPPYLDNVYVPENPEQAKRSGKVTAPVRFIQGLSHDDSHLGQLTEIMRQARVARGA